MSHSEIKNERDLIGAPDPITAGEWLVIIGLTTMALGFFALAIIGVVGLVNVIAG